MSSKTPKPEIDPLPSVGGSYLLDTATGKWVLQPDGVEQSAATTADTVTPESHGTDSESPAAGEH